MTLQEKMNSFESQCSFELKDYDKDMVKHFFDYWTEHSPGGKKLRYEFERTFDIKKRFATWKRNHDKWTKPTNVSNKPTFIEQVINKQNSLDELFKQIDNESINKIG